MTTDEYLATLPYREATWHEVALAYEAGKRVGRRAGLREMQERAVEEVKPMRSLEEIRQAIGKLNVYELEVA